MSTSYLAVRPARDAVLATDRLEVRLRNLKLFRDLRHRPVEVRFNDLLCEPLALEFVPLHEHFLEVGGVGGDPFRGRLCHKLLGGRGLFGRGALRRGARVHQLHPRSCCMREN